MPLNSWFRICTRCVFSLIGIVATAVSAWAQPPAPTVTGLPEELLPGLQAILKTAVSRSPDAIQASIEVDKAEARKIIGGSVLWPSLGGSARYAINDEAVSGSSNTSNRSSGFFYDFALNQPVFHWGVLKAQAEREKIGLKISERQYAEAYRTLSLAVRRGYLDLVMRKSALQALRYQLTLDEAEVENQRRRLEAKVAFAGEVALAELMVKQHKLDLDIAQAGFGAAKRGFVRVAGLEALDDDAIPGEVPRPKPADGPGDVLLRDFTGGGVENTWRAQVLKFGLAQNEQNYLIAKHRLHPKISLFAGYNVRSETQASVSSINQVAVAQRTYGIKADWSIFDGWATKGEKMQALAYIREFERRLKTHVDETTEEARARRENLGFAMRGLDLAEQRLDGARAILKFTQDESAAGRLAAAEIDRAKLALLQAESAILPARAEYLMQWAGFVSLVGADPAMNNLPARYVR